MKIRLLENNLSEKWFKSTENQQVTKPKNNYSNRYRQKYYLEQQTTENQMVSGQKAFDSKFLKKWKKTLFRQKTAVLLPRTGRKPNFISI